MDSAIEEVQKKPENQLATDIINKTKMISESDVIDIHDRYDIKYIPGSDTVYRLCMIIKAFEDNSVLK